jgi:hypothetical protein
VRGKRGEELLILVNKLIQNDVIQEFKTDEYYFHDKGSPFTM